MDCISTIRLKQAVVIKDLKGKKIFKFFNLETESQKVEAIKKCKTHRYQKAWDVKRRKPAVRLGHTLKVPLKPEESKCCFIDNIGSEFSLKILENKGEGQIF